jgi:hypothetical protein
MICGRNDPSLLIGSFLSMNNSGVVQVMEESRKIRGASRTRTPYFGIFVVNCVSPIINISR